MAQVPANAATTITGRRELRAYLTSTSPAAHRRTTTAAETVPAKLTACSSSADVCSARFRIIANNVRNGVEPWGGCRSEGRAGHCVHRMRLLLSSHRGSATIAETLAPQRGDALPEPDPCMLTSPPAHIPASPLFPPLKLKRALVLLTILGVTLGSAEAQSPDTAVQRPTEPAAQEGLAITPELAQAVFQRLVPLREADGCVLESLDTQRFRVDVHLRTGARVEHVAQLATTSAGLLRTRNHWNLTGSDDLRRDCPQTLAAIEREIAQVHLPSPMAKVVTDIAKDRPSASIRILQISFLLLLIGSIWVLLRETWRSRPPAIAVGLLLVLWAVAVALRLSLSPRTFLHEYFHIAETLTGYLSGNIAPLYGNLGPALFRLVAEALDRPWDVEVIFVTNAVLSSLAIPAVALLDLSLTRSWPRAVCAAALLCVLPLHLRFSAAEDLFIQTVTFSLWTAALFTLYVRTRRLFDALLAALALSLVMQSRPEGLFVPAVLMVLLLLTEARSWRLLFAWRSVIALVLLGVLLIQRVLDLQGAVGGGPTPQVPNLEFYLRQLVVLDPHVTPRLFLLLMAIGMVWGVMQHPGMSIWVTLTFVGYTVFSLTMFSNPVYNIRSQLLPTSYLVLIAAGCGSAWESLWRQRPRLGAQIGIGVLLLVAALVLSRGRPFITELFDQQMEWAFLARTAEQLPPRARLLAAVEVGPSRLNAFPDFLLQRRRENYRLIDVRDVAQGNVAWPAAGEDLLFYQGLYCYFAFSKDDPGALPVEPCAEVQRRYVTEPWLTDDITAPAYSLMQYTTAPPLRIGFFRLVAQR